MSELMNRGDVACDFPLPGREGVRGWVETSLTDQACESSLGAPPTPLPPPSERGGMNGVPRWRFGLVTALLVSLTAVADRALAQEDLVTEPGVSIRVYDIDLPMSKLRPLVPGQTPNVSKVIPLLDLRSERGDFQPLDYYFILHADGFLNITTPGTYEFELTSDDGSALWINSTKIVDNDLEHSTQSMTGSIELSEGLHPFDVQFFQGVGDANLWLKWKPPGSSSFEIVPSEALKARKGEVRVTSPGQKKVIMPLKRGKPGDGQPLEAVHPSFDLAQARPSWFQPRVGGIDWLSDGTMVVCLWDAEGSVFFLKGADGEDPEQIEVVRFAAGLAEPLGIRVVDDRIYVLQKQELTELIDHDKDGVADEYRCVCSGWDVTANFHEFAFGLVYHDGFFYGNLAIAINPGGASTRPQVAQRGSIVRISTDGTYEIAAHGLRTPNGIGFGVDGEIFVTDNQGDWLPVSKAMHFKPGAFYGSRAVMEDQTVALPVMEPVVWLPQGEIGNSPGEVTPFNFGPYQNQMIHSDVTHGGLKRVFAEKIDGNYQGVVFRMTQGLEAGINRVRQAPGSDSLYVGGIGSTGNWGQEGKLKYGLQRLTYNGRSTFEMLAVRAMSNGIEIEFTEPLPPQMGWSPDRYSVEQFRYEPTPAYGGPKLDQQRLEVTSASVSDDRTRVFLELDGMLPKHVLYVWLLGPWASEAGNAIWSTEAWYTMNAIPTDRIGNVAPAAHQPKLNQLTDAERAEGWKLLFDGKTTTGWHGFGQRAMPAKGWEVDDDSLACIAGGGGGDIVTDETFSDFELSFEWKVAPGGNSGVFFRVSEDEPYVWLTGPEMQILDNERHRDGENPVTSAGSNYALHAPEADYSYPAGSFNQSRLVVNGNHVEHWLNGTKLFEYEIGSQDWTSRVNSSKFRDMPKYGRNGVGHIALQDHGDRVWFRNIKIRPLE
jgi:cytochrome c